MYPIRIWEAAMQSSSVRPEVKDMDFSRASLEEIREFFSRPTAPKNEPLHPKWLKEIRGVFQRSPENIGG
jgi:hypothetical protein